MFETGLTAYTEGVNEPGIIKLEHSLLELAGCPDLLNGLFYMLPLYTNGHLYIRYIYMSYFAYACKTEGQNGISSLISALCINCLSSILEYSRLNYLDEYLV